MLVWLDSWVKSWARVVFALVQFMRPLTTVILLGLTAVAVGFIFFFESRRPGTVEAAERARILLDLPVDGIGKIEITNAAGRVKLERGPGDGGQDRWTLTSPV